MKHAVNAVAAVTAQPKEHRTMTSRTGLRRRYGRNGEHGQMVVLFALTLIAIITMAGLLIDGGMAWANRRQAQAAADTAALAAAQAIVGGAVDNGLSAARSIANANGFQTPTDCNGTALANGGVTVNVPPSSQAASDHQTNQYVEVVTTRAMRTTFAGAVGMSCWMVTSRAVASIGSESVAQCSFCSLNKRNKNHTLVLKNGATLRVDGDIYVDSTNGGTTPADCDDSSDLKQFNVCGDAFDVFGDGGHISARTISVTGGWETHDGNPTVADGLALHNTTTNAPCSPASGTCVPCALHPDPPSQLAAYKPSNVCIHMPQITDPLLDIPVPAVPAAPVANVNGCPAGALTGAGIDISSGSATICPGLYTGGISIQGTASVTMRPGPSGGSTGGVSRPANFRAALPSARGYISI